MDPCDECGRSGYLNPALTVDAVALRGMGSEREVLLIRRRNEPWKGCWAFPGGFVDKGEDTESAVLRELLEECGIKVCKTVADIGKNMKAILKGVGNEQ